MLDFNYPGGPTLEEKLEDIVICAPSFEEFIYRSWVENKIWHAHVFKLSKTKEEEEYLQTALKLMGVI